MQLIYQEDMLSISNNPLKSGIIAHYKNYFFRRISVIVPAAASEANAIVSESEG